jgi:YHS domain-containing protein
MTRRLSISLFISVLAFAQPVAEVFVNAQNTAIEGYDSVAYFTAGKPVKGSAEHSLQWNGATWHFSTAANKAAFEADPLRYAPQYGGFCAFGLSRGYKAKIDPLAWSIVKGKLYLNYNDSVQKSWSKDAAGFIAKADAAWPTVKSSTKVAR